MNGESRAAMPDELTVVNVASAISAAALLTALLGSFLIYRDIDNFFDGVKENMTEFKVSSLVKLQELIQ